MLVFLHGNHSTCRQVKNLGGSGADESSLYAEKGTCEPSYEELPSYLGYEYLARNLASHGYVVVSINANRGINGWDMDGSADPWLIEARGRLVLKHLAWLRDWDRGSRPSKVDTNLDLKGKIDFSHVGLMGHSRGGEGVRAALSLYRAQDPNSYAKLVGPMTVEGVFEFAPVDLNGSRPYNAPAANWTVVIGSCDGDVKDFQGTGTFRRRRLDETTPTFSSIFLVPGANHNFFNTEWKFSDSGSCPSGETPLFSPVAAGSATQQQVGVMTCSAFFRGFVGKSSAAKNFRRVFDPQYRLPSQLTQLLSPVRESLRQGSGEKVAFMPNLAAARGVKIEEFTESLEPEMLGTEDLKKAQRKVISMSWDQPSSSAVYAIAGWEKPRDLRGTWIISLALARFQKCFLRSTGKTCEGQSSSPTDIGISLIMADGSVSATVRLKDYATLGDAMNEHLTINQCPSPFVWNSSEQMCTIDIKNEWTCARIGGFWSGELKCTLNLYEGFQHALIFQEIPIELADFKAANLSAVKGIRLTFDRTPGGTLLLDRTITLRSTQGRNLLR